MKHFDSILKMYADSGLRTSEDWISLGREIESGAKPRVDAPHRGAMVPLFTRDQTRLHVSARSKPKGD